MRLNKIPVFCAMAASLAISCATAPPPVVVDTVPKPETEMAKATERRALIKENGLEAYAPDTFKQAEDNFTAAGKRFTGRTMPSPRNFLTLPCRCMSRR